ncbi:MAG TPA: DDE-type integrase/transposase/recombinase, partial [Candidatus Nanoarchaeia archaeon]|nr:DDE-type integrase/transposase/recombinase [Candidatus Nanoarchaeia archaeon]
HDAPSVGHQGVAKMTQALRNIVWWPEMLTDIYDYCKYCLTCQRFKPAKQKIPSASNPPPARCLEQVSMDIVGPLPNSNAGSKYALCIQDRLSRFLIFAAMPDASAETTARIFLNKWVCHYGVPKKIVTDRGRNFMSTVFRHLCQFLGVKHSPTTAYRPQGNSENERSHKDLHSYLAMYLEEADASNWDSLLAFAAWAHNSTYHTTIKRSPLEVLTGIRPRSLFETPSKTELERVTLEEYLNLRDDQISKLAEETRLAIAKAQAKTVERLNPYSREMEYFPGQKVFLRRHYLRLIHQKWGPKYQGPYVIKERVSPQVVKVYLEEDPSYEDIVHTSYVRPFFEMKEDENDVLDEEEEDRDLPVISFDALDNGVTNENHEFLTPEKVPNSIEESPNDKNSVTPSTPSFWKNLSKIFRSRDSSTADTPPSTLKTPVSTDSNKSSTFESVNSSPDSEQSQKTQSEENKSPSKGLWRSLTSSVARQLFKATDQSSSRLTPEESVPETVNDSTVLDDANTATVPGYKSPTDKETVSVPIPPRTRAQIAREKLLKEKEEKEKRDKARLELQNRQQEARSQRLQTLRQRDPR